MSPGARRLPARDAATRRTRARRRRWPTLPRAPGVANVASLTSTSRRPRSFVAVPVLPPCRGPYTPHITLVASNSTYADPEACEMTPVLTKTWRICSSPRPPSREPDMTPDGTRRAPRTERGGKCRRRCSQQFLAESASRRNCSPSVRRRFRRCGPLRDDGNSSAFTSRDLRATRRRARFSHARRSTRTAPARRGRGPRGPALGRRPSL